MNQSEELQKFGFLYVPDLLSSGDVDYFKDLADKYHGDYSKFHNEVTEIVSKIAVKIKTILGDNIYFTGNFEFRSESLMHPYAAHHDAKGALPLSTNIKEIVEKLSTNFRDEFKVDSYDYPVIRIAIYLDDFSINSGATKMYPGSHRKNHLLSPFGLFNLFTFKLNKIFHPFQKSINPKITPGGAVFFNARTYHSGQFVKYRLFPNVSLPNFFDDIIKFIRYRFPITKSFLEKYIIYPFIPARRSIFLDFCYDSVISSIYQADRFFCGNSGLSEVLNDNFCANFYCATDIKILPPYVIRKYVDVMIHKGVIAP